MPGLYSTLFGYDSRGRLTSVSTGTRQSTFTYDASGNTASVTDPLQRVTSYSYDGVGKLTAIGRPDGTTVRYSYDGNGNMTVLTTPSGVDHDFGYTGVNLNSSYQAPLSGTYSYTYDRDRRFTSTLAPSGKEIKNTYSGGVLTRIDTPEGAIDLSYLCASKLGSTTRGNEGISYGYDGSLLTSETITGTLNQSVEYTYYNGFMLKSLTYAGVTSTVGRKSVSVSGNQ